MARLSDGANVPTFSVPASSSNFCFFQQFWFRAQWYGHPLWYHNGWEARRFSKFSQLTGQIEQIPFLANEMSRMDSHSTKTRENFTTRLAEMEQNFSTHTARMCIVETCSFRINCIRFGTILAIRWTGWRLHSHRVPWPRIIWFLILLQAPKMNNHEVSSYYSSPVKMTTLGLRIGSKASWKSNIPAYKPIRINCKTGGEIRQIGFRGEIEVPRLCGPIQGLFFQPCEVYGPFCHSGTIVTDHQSKTLEDQEIGNRFAHFWEFLQQSSKNFSERDDTGTFIVCALDVRSQVDIIKDYRSGVGKPVFKIVQFR